MSNKHITKSFRLSSEFNTFAFKHPEIFKGVPRNACIVMAEKTDKNFTDENIKMAKKIIEKEKKRCYAAIKEKTYWKLQQIEI